MTAGLLRYELSDGDVSEEVCYWKDMTLVPHLINLCSKRAVQASVHFNHLREGNADRKQLARQFARGSPADETLGCHLKFMKVIVTCDPSYEPVDQMCRLINFATGELGVHLSHQLASAGFEVFCLTGSGATHPGPGESVI